MTHYHITKQNYDDMINRMAELEYLLLMANGESAEWRVRYEAVQGLTDRMLEVMVANGGVSESVISSDIVGPVVTVKPDVPGNIIQFPRGENHD